MFRIADRLKERLPSRNMIICFDPHPSYTVIVRQMVRIHAGWVETKLGGVEICVCTWFCHAWSRIDPARLSSSDIHAWATTIDLPLTRYAPPWTGLFQKSTPLNLVGRISSQEGFSSTASQLWPNTPPKIGHPSHQYRAHPALWNRPWTGGAGTASTHARAQPITGSSGQCWAATANAPPPIAIPCLTCYDALASKSGTRGHPRSGSNALPAT